MNLNDLQNKARKVIAQPYEPTTLNRWISERKALFSAIQKFNRLAENYEGLNRPLVLN